jgi:uncharacterized protein YbbK (DUF523 family)
VNIDPIRLGISRCLLGDHVRYDGGHKRDDVLVNALACHVEWVPVCPEVEAGLGVPREPMQLVGSGPNVHLMTVTTKQDRTILLTQFSVRRVCELKALNLSGYIFKARSPSCGIDKVPVYDEKGNPKPIGIGLFAQAFREAFPLIPICDETRLADPMAREQFLTQVRQYHQQMMGKKSVGHQTITSQWNLPTHES